VEPDVTGRKADLGELESLIMLAVLRLEGEASVGRIREEIAERGGRALSRGATYATVARLERKGLLSLTIEEGGAGGRPVHHCRVTKRGLETLRTAQQHLVRMRAGLEAILKVAK
jgi:PadR family transcriptional regulator, regulatory protein PadR